MKLKINYLLVLAIIVFVYNQSAVTAYASEFQRNQVEVAEYELQDETTNTENSDIYYEQLRGSSPPTTEFDLTVTDYSYMFANVTSHTYTSAFFRPDSNGCISISVNGINSGGKDMKLSLYRYVAPYGIFDVCVSTWIGNPQSIQGLGFNNLSSSSYYYFKFEPYSADSISGSGIIHHP